jgi:hypothetical protein
MKKKPLRKWTKADVLRRALDFETRNAFGKGEFGAYMYARRHGFLDEACKHMRQVHRPPNYFADYGRCKAEAAKYNTRTAFHVGCCSAYDHALSNGWLDEICSHMPPRSGATRNHWDASTIRAEAQRFTTRKEFEDNSPGAIQSARRLGLLDEVCQHMVSKYRLPRYGSGRIYWTKEKCRIAALEFKTRTEFQDGSPSAYRRALKEGWLEDICGHMRLPTPSWKRAIYAYEFRDKSAYVGLTYNYEQRHQQHLTDTRKRLHKKLHSVGYMMIRNNIWMGRREAQAAERDLVEKYRKSGWQILNRVTAGQLGGTARKWFKNTCAREAKKYQTRVAFIQGSSGAYDAAKNMGWLDEVCAHMKRQRVRKWTKAMLIAEAQKYTTLKEFRKQVPSAYGVVCKKGWLDEICGRLRKHNEWTQHAVLVAVENLGGAAAFKKAHPTAYRTAVRSGWIQPLPRNPNYKTPSTPCWTLERLKAEAAKYQTRMEFNERASGAYSAARKRKLIDEVCAHMTSAFKPRGYWDNKERVLAAAKKFETRAKFTKGNGSAYYAAIRNGWLDQACAHMRQGKTPNGTWTKQRVMQEARRFTTRRDFQRLGGGAYHAAHRKGWLDEACAHIPRQARSRLCPAHSLFIRQRCI